MKRAIYILIITCSPLLSACMDDTPSAQTGDELCRLSPRFMQGGSITDPFSASREARTLVTGIGASGDGNISEIGVCITGTGHDEYPGMEGSGTRYTFQTTDAKKWTCYKGSTTSSSPFSFTLNGENATLQAFHPASSAVTALASGNAYTIPVTIPATQTFAGNNRTGCSTTDYLYGSKTQNRGSAETITANALNASPTIYMQHALAQVAFKIQYAADRTPDNEHDCVKSIQLVSSTNCFKTTTTDGSGTMQIDNGTLGSLTGTGTLTFNATSGTEVPVGDNGSPSVVAYGLVAPITKPDGTITLNITLGKKGETTYDRTYTATTTAFNVAWEKGYCYNYNLVLGNKLTVTQVTTTWTDTPTGDTPAVTPKEKGISNANELIAFATAWNESGLTNKGDGTPDYSPYEDYGWYEKDENGKRIFTIKITNSFVISTVAGTTWIPIGNDSHPLTIPFDGQGWQISFDLTDGKQVVADGSTYAGIVGYTRSNISNVRILCSFNAGSAGADAENNFLESGAATYTGVLVGKSEGEITNCTVEMTGTTLLSKPATSEVYLGGLVGHCSKNISNCAVYQAYSAGATIKIAPTATSTIYMGALAGKVEGAVNNSYTYIGSLQAEEPTTTTSSTVNAGWLTGSGSSFSACHYYTGTPTGCTPGDYSSVTGVQSMTDLTGLCTALNADLTAHPLWTRWTEVKENTTDQVTSVFLFDYRNKK